MVMGTFKEHMAYIGRELMTELHRVNLPVYDIREEMPDNFLSSLDTSGIRSATDGLVVPRGGANKQMEGFHFAFKSIC
jgi:hypothetical protein